MSRKRVVFCMWLGLLVLVLSGCGGSNSPSRGVEGNPSAYGKVVRVRGGFYRGITPEDLVDMLAAGDATLVNVHIPYEGEIEPTDAFIPFSEVEKHLDELPRDKDATIVLYCRSGVMSADAAQVLVRLGYTGIHDLRGGMNAWKAAGQPVLVKPR